MASKANLESISDEGLAKLQMLWRQEHKRQRLEQSTKPSQFNIFRLLRRQSDELSHSDFIGSLLDPSAEHGQGDIFLRAFLKLLQKRNAALNDFTDQTFDQWSVVREKSTAWGRLDIVLSSERTRTLIVIENKINAQEGKDQIARYRTYINARPHFLHRLLIYLTLEGDKSESGKEDCQLSYRNDIHDWLKNALPQVKASGINDLILQYLQALPLENYSMSEPDSLTRQLATPGYIEAAMAVGERFIAVKTLLFRQFYSAICIRIKDSLKKELLDYEFDEGEFDDYSASWSAISFLPKARNDKRNYAYWRLEKFSRNGDGEILYGIATNQRSEELRGPQLQDLINKMEKDGFELTNPWWVRRKQTGHDTRKAAFWTAVALNNDVAYDLADQVVTLFRETRKMVEELN